MTVSEYILSATQRLIADLSQMGPTVLALNCLLSVLVTGAIVLAALGARRLLRFGWRKLPGRTTAERQIRKSRIERRSWLILRLAAVVAVVLIVPGIWGVDVVGWATQGAGEGAVKLFGRVAIVLVLAIAANEAVGYFIDHGVGRLARRGRDDPRRVRQLRTLGPLVRGVARATVLIVGGTMLLGEVGVSIGPLLAGAGVVGIAVGFGAQSLVKDLLTGAFLIVEDVVSVGDVVRIGEFGGQVEAMTLRTIRLRDFDGTLHVFPYSEAPVVHNMTRTYSFYVFDLRISYDSDVNRALELMHRTGDELRADPSFRDRILEPIEVVGVDGLGDSGVALKARIKTRPIEQWNVGREFNRRIKDAFEQAGVRIAAPRLALAMPGDAGDDLGGLEARA